METNKLTLISSKCHRIHIGKRKQGVPDCPEINVYEEKMKDSKKEKYLGESIDGSRKIRSTIEDRKNKGYGIVSEILTILDEIPLEWRLD